MTLEHLAALLFVLLLIALVYIFTNGRLKKPVGGLVINLAEDGLTARVAVILYKDYDISDIANRDYIVLKIDKDFDLKSINTQQ